MFDEWMYADAAHTAEALSDPLTDEQQALFDRGYRSARQHAMRVARKVAGRTNAEDIVHAALVRLMHQVTRKEDRQPMPADETEFEQRLVGLTCLIGRASVSSHGASPSRRKSPDRMLTHDMETLESVEHVEIPLPDDFVDQREKDRSLYFLQAILLFNVYRLGPMQAQVLAYYVEETPRAVAAAKLGISVKTFDNTLRRAKDRMREGVLSTVLVEDIRFPVCSDWMTTLWDMEDRRIAAMFAKRETIYIDTSACRRSPKEAEVA